jgi:hypothetical protein
MDCHDLLLPFRVSRSEVAFPDAFRPWNVFLVEPVVTGLVSAQEELLEREVLVLCLELVGDNDFGHNRIIG